MPVDQLERPGYIHLGGLDLDPSQSVDLEPTGFEFPQGVWISTEDLVDISSCVDAVRQSITGIGLEIQVRVLREIVGKLERALT